MKLLGCVLGFELGDTDAADKMDTDIGSSSSSGSSKKDAPSSSAPKPTSTTTTQPTKPSNDQTPVGHPLDEKRASSQALFFLRQADAEKDKGNEAYKKKDFETALNHYNKASELDPNNMTYYTNRAGQWRFSACFCTHVCISF